MIKTIAPKTSHIHVSHYGAAHIPSYSSNQNGAIGTMRYNPTAQNIEVWDGNTWMSVTQHAEVGLSQDVIELLEWARQERDKQLRYERMAETNVTVADALESVKDAELRLREIAILCEESTIPGNN